MVSERTPRESRPKDGVQSVELPGLPEKEDQPSNGEDGIRVYDAQRVLVGIRNLREHRRPAVDKYGEIIEGKFDYCTRPCCQSSAAKIRSQFIPALPKPVSDVPSPRTDEEGDAPPSYDPWV